MKILVPSTDRSTPRRRSYTAIDLVKTKGGELFVLTVVPTLRGVRPGALGREPRDR